MMRTTAQSRDGTVVRPVASRNAGQERNRMRLRHGPFWFFTLLAAAGVLRADDSIATAYDAVLRGDYKLGREVAERIGDAATGDAVKSLRTWLESYEGIAAQRETLRKATFDWNVAQSQRVFDEAKKIDAGTLEPDLTPEQRTDRATRRTYLALSFAAQAAAYAADASEFAAEPWVKELRARALTAARHFLGKEDWTHALNFCALLERIDRNDADAKEGREKATRYVRLELVYSDAKEVDRRIEGVTYEVLQEAMNRIAEMYHTKPKFQEMADGALDALEALCHTTKLYDRSSAFDGIANPTSRAFFLKRLAELRREISDEKDFDQTDLLKLFRAVQRASDESVSLPKGLLVVEFTEGALGKLDQFTQMIWPADATEFDKVMMGNFYGVGIQLGIDETSGRLKVATPLENSPALRAGIQPDDLIVAVDGRSTKDWTTERAVREITGREGTQVTLTIYRPVTGKKLEFPLTRSAINLTTVRGVNRLDGDHREKWNYIIDKDAGIAYMRLTGFNPDSYGELTSALKDAKNQGMRGLILDLRYNPGGLLDVAVDVVSAFMKAGEVVSTRGRSKEERLSYATQKKPEFPELPMVVLINEGSASASEILSGALQDYERAAILGERSFGKGSVQKVVSLDRRLWNNSRPPTRLKLTTSLYYLPNGRSPHKAPGAELWGVDPDWRIELTPKEISKVLEQERKAFIIHNEDATEAAMDEATRAAELAALKNEAIEKPGDEEDAETSSSLLSDDDIKLLRSDPYKAPDTDPQLQTALLQLRVKLAGGLPWPRSLAKHHAAPLPDKP